MSIRQGVFLGRRALQPLRLAAGMGFTLLCALSVHVVMLQVLHVPFPSHYPGSGWLESVNVAGISLGTILLYSAASKELGTLSFAKRWIILFVLITGIRESLLRVPVMTGVVTTAYRYAFLAHVPQILPLLLLALLVVALNPLLTKPWPRVFGSAIVYLFVFRVFKPLVNAAFVPVLHHFSYLAHDEVYAIPYGVHVLVPAYISYLEPVLASMVTAHLIWRKLSTEPVARLAQFSLLLLLVRRHLLTPLVYAVYEGKSWKVALLSTSQFTLETMTLAVLTVLTYQWANRLPYGRRRS